MSSARRSVLRVAIIGIALLLSAAPALAGGWATVRLDKPHDKVLVEVPTTVGFTVLQHDVHPVNVGRATLFAQHKEKGEKLTADARQDGPEGHYLVEVTFPLAGEWKWGVNADLWGEMAFETLTVLSSADEVAADNPIAAEMGRMHPAGIHAGTCDGLNAGIAFELDDVRLGEPDAAAPVKEMVGAETAFPVATSISSIDAPLTEIIGGDHAINVLADGTAKDAIACGDIGGLMVGDELAVGLGERNASGYTGVALLRAVGDRTEVTIYLARDPAGVGSEGASASADATTVTIVNGAFSPARLEIAPGTTVTWRNEDGIAHSVMGDDLAFDDSSVLSPGQSFSQSFDTSGTYTYKCGPHPGMVGTITVKEAVGSP